MKNKSVITSNRWMMVIGLSFIISHLLCVSAGAQTTFTQQLQLRKEGQGVVTIHHDHVIDSLVNGQPAPAQPVVPAQPGKGQASEEAPHGGTEVGDSQGVATDSVAPNPRRLRHGVKMAGFRLQVFAGGSKAADKARAYRTKEQLRAIFPEEAVYVNFVSPRWLCRMGNYRTYEEASQVLMELRRMGFTSAAVVKDKITVYDN